MFHYSWKNKIVVAIVGVLFCSGVVFIVANGIFQTDQAPQTPPKLPATLRTPSPTRPTYCVPLPQESATDSSRTPTPDRYSSPEPYFHATVTPRGYSHVYDLSPELPLIDKSEIVVFRCDGTFDLYLIGPDVNLDQNINLYPGDVIISSAPPASMMGHEPPEPTFWASPVTEIPYPPPIIFTQTTTPFSYPAPATLTPVDIEP